MEYARLTLSNEMQAWGCETGVRGTIGNEICGNAMVELHYRFEGENVRKIVGD